MSVSLKDGVAVVLSGEERTVLIREAWGGVAVWTRNTLRVTKAHPDRDRESIRQSVVAVVRLCARIIDLHAGEPITMRPTFYTTTGREYTLREWVTEACALVPGLANEVESDLAALLPRWEANAEWGDE